MGTNSIQQLEQAQRSGCPVSGSLNVVTELCMQFIEVRPHTDSDQFWLLDCGSVASKRFLWPE